MKKMILTSLSVLALTAGSAFAADAPTPKGPVPAGDHHGMARHMFEETDTNHDGAISKDEWNAKGDKMFSDIDANKDGKITPDEMKAHHDAKHAEWEKHKAEGADKFSGKPKADAVTPTESKK